MIYSPLSLSGRWVDCSQPARSAVLSVWLARPLCRPLGRSLGSARSLGRSGAAVGSFGSCLLLGSRGPELAGLRDETIDLHLRLPPRRSVQTLLCRRLPGPVPGPLCSCTALYPTQYTALYPGPSPTLPDPEYHSVRPRARPSTPPFTQTRVPLHPTRNTALSDPESWSAQPRVPFDPSPILVLPDHKALGPQ